MSQQTIAGYVNTDGVVVPVTAALPLPVTGTGTSEGVAQASDTAGQTGSLVQGATTTSNPSYTTAKTNPLSLDTAGNLRTVVAASENHIGQVGSPVDVITVSLTVATNAYTAGDVLAATQEIANCVRVTDGRALLQSLCVIDTDDQGADLDLIFFSANTSLGTEESAPDIDDTEVLTILGHVSVLDADTPYLDLGGSKIATVKNIGLVLEAASGGRSVYVAAITRETPTYASGVVTLKLSVLQG